MDGDYVGEADESPLRFDVSLAPGAHRVRVRAVVGAEEVSTDARFTVVGGIPEDFDFGAVGIPAAERDVRLGGSVILERADPNPSGDELVTQPGDTLGNIRLPIQPSNT